MEYNFGEHKIEVRESGTGSFSPWHRDAYEREGLLKGMICTADMAMFTKIDENIYRIIKGIVYIDSFCKQLVYLSKIHPDVAEEYLNYLVTNCIEEFTLEKVRSVEESLERIKNRKC